PLVNAGSDELHCEGQPFNFSTQTTGASSSAGTTITWVHNGSGTLMNASSHTPTYNAGIGETGIITFTLSAENSNGSCVATTDQMQLNIQQNPVITTAPSGQTLCEGGMISLSVTATG